MEHTVTVSAMREVTVVIPTRNRWPFLQRALRTVFSQEDVELEVIVVDDGSTDQTSDGLAAIEDARLRVIRHATPVGVARARNAAVDIAEAPWIGFLDDDDLWAPQKMRKQLALGAADDVVLVYCGTVFVDESGAAHHVRIPDAPASRDELLRWNVIGSPSGVLARTDLVRAVGGFDESFAVFADWDLWLRLSRHGVLVGCPEPLVAYSLHSGGMSTGDTAGLIDELRHLRMKYATAEPPLTIEPDRVTLARWLAGGQRRAGRRLVAVRTYVGSGVRDRNAGNLLRGFALLFGERSLRAVRGSRDVPNHIEWLDATLGT
jgi:glycosyltransferase involved in cell wall biosynthesis